MRARILPTVTSPVSACIPRRLRGALRSLSLSLSLFSLCLCPSSPCSFCPLSPYHRPPTPASALCPFVHRLPFFPSVLFPVLSLPLLSLPHFSFCRFLPSPRRYHRSETTVECTTRLPQSSSSSVLLHFVLHFLHHCHNRRLLGRSRSCRASTHR